MWVFRSFTYCNGNINKTRTARFDLWTAERPFLLRVFTSVFLKVQNATFIKKLRFELTKRRYGLGFFENARFGLGKLNQTGS